MSRDTNLKGDDLELLKWWWRTGGDNHGPNVETWTMPEKKILPLLRRLRAAEEACERIAELPAGSLGVYRKFVHAKNIAAKALGTPPT